MEADEAGKPARCKAEAALAGGWRGGRSSSGGEEEVSRQWMRGEAPPCLRQVKSEFVEFVFVLESDKRRPFMAFDQNV